MPERLVDIGTSRFTKIHSVDERGAGNAFHEYDIVSVQTEDIFSTIRFQKGPIKEAGVNGIFIEDLIAICIDRLECFQEGPGKCEENANALTDLKGALGYLSDRTTKRIEKNVEAEKSLVK